MHSTDVKQHIKELYLFDNTLTPRLIKNAIEQDFKMFISEKTIRRVLKEIKEYIDSQKKAQEERKQLEEKIFSMYFYHNMYESVISKQLCIPQSTISDILKRNPLYAQLKEEKKRLNEAKNKAETVEYIKKSREASLESRQARAREEQHIVSKMQKNQSDNARSMSRTRKISKDGLVLLNLQHYTLNEERTHLIFDNSIGVAPKDLKVKVSVKLFKPKALKTYEESFEKDYTY